MRESSTINIPKVGLGLWKITDPDEFQTAFDSAIQAGYRHFDSAQAYKNEQLLGKAWRGSGLKREDLFLTTKIHVTKFGTRLTPKSFETSLKKLRTEYVDLVLLHFPVTLSRKAAWLQLEKIKASGKARNIGVSNYTVKHLEEMKSYASEMPSVNQVELHVFLQQPDLIDYCQKHDIVVEAYSPLAHGRGMDDPILHSIAKKHSKSPAQVMLKWCLSLGLVILPKSVNPQRIKENIDLYDFDLDKEDLAQFKTLDRNLRTCWDPTFVP